MRVLCTINKEFIFTYMSLETFIHENASHAHWAIFTSIILAGLNVPISTDIVVLIGAVLAARVVPENTLLLYASVYFGCVLSACVAYGMGRFLGPKLLKFGWFSKMLPQERLDKIQTFYTKHGFLTLIIGRFIPFGVRNGIFMSSGLSKVSFRKFLMRDSVACLLWSAIAFTAFFKLSQYYEEIVHFFKTWNLLVFLALSVTLIGIVWYKKKKSSKKLN
jgi:membrane-associated protein